MKKIAFAPDWGRLTRVLLGGTFLFGCLGARAGAQEGEVSFKVSPQWLDPSTTIEVVFPSPMVAEPGEAKVSPVEVEPALAGAFQWTSSRGGILKLAEPPRFNERYTFRLRMGMKDAEGRDVAARVLGAANSAGFQVVDQDPKWFNRSDVPRRQSLLVQFNDEVDPEAAAKFILFRTRVEEGAESSDDAARAVAVTPSVGAAARHATKEDFRAVWGHTQATWTEQIAGIEPEAQPGRERRSALVVEPAEPLPPGNWEMLISGDLANASGAARLGSPVVAKLGTVRAFEVARVRAVTPFDRPYEMRISFNKPVALGGPGEDAAAARARLESVVSIKPRPDDLKWSWSHDEVVASGSFETGRKYSVQVSGDIAAADGLPLKAAHEAPDMQFEPNPPHIGAPAFVNQQMARGTGEFAFTAANVTAVRARVKRLTGSQMAEAREKFYPYWRAFERDVRKRREHQPVAIEDYPGEFIFERTFTMDKPLDQSEKFALNWRDVLPAGAGAGALLVELEGDGMPGLKDKSVVAQSLIEFTDLGVLLKGSGREQLVFVTSLETGKPVASAQVTLLDGERRLIGHGVTGDDGVARVRAAKPGHVLVETEDDTALLSINGIQETELWGIYGWELSRTWADVWSTRRQTHTFTDRDVYRPGDTVYLKALTRLASGDLLSLDGRETEARLRLRDGNWRVIRDEPVTFSASGGFDTTLTLPEGPLGYYSVEFFFPDRRGGGAGGDEDDGEGTSGHHGFRVEDYRPNTFEIQIDSAGVVWSADEVRVPVSASYFMGKPLSSAEVRWHAESWSDFTPPEAFAAYHFGPEPVWSEYSDESEDEEDGEPRHDPAYNWYVHGEVELDNEGAAWISLPAPPRTRSALPLDISVGVSVTDINEQTITARARMRAPGGALLPGIRGSQGFARAGRPLELHLIAVDGEFQPVKGRVSGELLIEREEHVSQKIEAAGGVARIETQTRLREVVRRSVTLAAADGAVTASALEAFTPDQSGLYFVTLTTTDDQGVTALSRLPVYVIGGGFPWRLDGDHKLVLVPESATVPAGGEAVIAVQSPIEGTALVTVERNEVRQHLVREFKLDDPVIRIPVGEGDSPNVFISVAIARGSAASGKKFAMPELRAGYTEIQVPVSAAPLTAELLVDSGEVLPGGDVTVTVVTRDAGRRPLPGADVTLWAVDEGVLSLTHFPTPDPNQHFHQPFPLAVSNHTSLPMLMAEDPGARLNLNKGFLIGGGGDEEELDIDLRKNFVATPLWRTGLLTNENGQAKVTFQAPDNLSRFRLMAVASAGAERFASAESAFKVNKPLMVEPVLPRFARLGDEVIVKALVHNTTDQPRQVEVSLRLDENAEFISGERPFLAGAEVTEAGNAPGGERSRSLSLAAGASVTAAFPVRFSRAGREAVWSWTARESGGELRDGAESRLLIGHPVPELRELRHFTLGAEAAEGNLLAGFNPELLEGDGTLTIRVSATRMSDLEQALDYLLQYPYGCAEQTTSSTLPWIALSGYQHLFPNHLAADSRKAAIQRGVDRLQRMLVYKDSDGLALAYWPGAQEANRWATAYGTLMLTRALDTGASMPRATLDKLLNYLSSTLRGLDKETDSHVVTDAALTLYTLARAKRAEPAYHRMLFERRGRLPDTARLYLGLAMLLADAPHAEVKQVMGLEPPPAPAKPAPAAKGGKAGKAAPAPAVAAADPYLPPETGGFGHWAGPGVNDALRLIACAHMGSVRQADALAERIWSRRNQQGHWGNTYVNSWILTALAAHDRSRRKPGAEDAPTEVLLAWGGESRALPLAAGQPGAVSVIELNSEMIRQELRLTVPDGVTAYARVEGRAHPRQRDFQGENRGFGITRDYRRLLPDGSTEPADNLRVGDLVRVSLGIEISEAARFLAIEDSLPSVLEAVNPNLQGQDGPVGGGVFDGYEAWYCDHREMRADRVLFFTDHAPDRGRFVLHYLARVIAEGDTIAPPAKVEAMYEPSRHGLSPTRRFVTLPSPRVAAAR